MNACERMTCSLRLPCKAWVMSGRTSYYGLLVDVQDAGDGRVLAGFENSHLQRTYIYCRPNEIMLQI